MSHAIHMNEPPGIDGYRVVVRDGCTLVIGPIPVSHFAALAKADSKDAVVSTQLARLAGATFAWGSKDAVDALVRKMTADRLAVKAGAPELTGLQRWLAVGEQGSSSLAIVAKLRPEEFVTQGYVPPTSERAHPHDPDDLRRCLLLLRAAPELRMDLHRMAEVSPQWAALVRAWAELEESFEAEVGPGWADGKVSGEAPRTFDLMEALLAQADDLAKQGSLFGGAHV